MLERFHLLPTQASTMAGRVDALFAFLVAVTAFFTILIGVLVVTFMVRFRRRSEDEQGHAGHGSLALEAFWTLVPLGIVMVIFFWGASIYASLKFPPDDALEVTGIGKQWMWKFQHREGRREINELHVPVGRSVKVTLTSEDVIHSFYVPAFRVKQDAVPGRYNAVWFQATKPGRYHLFCTEYCGTLHAGMIGWVIAMEPDDFQAWLAAGGTAPAGASAAAAAPPTPAALGEALFTSKGCVACHLPTGKGNGPSLAGIFGHEVELTTGETVVADEAYLRESILAPHAKLVKGYLPIMPPYQGTISEEGVLQLIAYVKSLADGGAKP